MPFLADCLPRLSLRPLQAKIPRLMPPNTRIQIDNLAPGQLQPPRQLPPLLHSFTCCQNYHWPLPCHSDSKPPRSHHCHGRSTCAAVGRCRCPTASPCYRSCRWPVFSHSNAESVALMNHDRAKPGLAPPVSAPTPRLQQPSGQGGNGVPVPAFCTVRKAQTLARGHRSALLNPFPSSVAANPPWAIHAPTK